MGSLCLRRRPAPGRDGRELLVVVERYGLDDKQRWKLPGGAVDAGEVRGHMRALIYSFPRPNEWGLVGMDPLSFDEHCHVR